MEPMDVPILDTACVKENLLEISNVGAAVMEDEVEEVEKFRYHVDEMYAKVDEVFYSDQNPDSYLIGVCNIRRCYLDADSPNQIEQRVNEVAQFYSSLGKKQLNSSKGSLIVKDKDKEKQIINIKKQQQDAAKKETPSGKRMQELMRQFGTIMRQITLHKWAWPFMEPVDVEALGLPDYHEVIGKPMDFSTIKNRMEAKDGNGYKNVREICADVRLVFKNAMTYNDERHDIHVMAKTLLAKFEEKWLQLLPKVIEEETRRKEEEAEAHLDMQLAQEAANAKMALDIRNELYEIDMHLDELRETVVQKCRKMSIEEKRQLGSGLSRLSPEDLTKALEIIAQKNSSFQTTAEEVDVDMDAQSESTLWRLKFFVKEALEAQGKSSASKDSDDNSKRKREICDALAKTAKKRRKTLVVN